MQHTAIHTAFDIQAALAEVEGSHAVATLYAKAADTNTLAIQTLHASDIETET